MRSVVTLAALSGLALAGCSSGGGEGGTGAFTVDTISLQDGQTWQINRPIEIRFSAPVAFGSVSMNTINISQVGGAPALGGFYAKDARTVVFQPRCPSKDDFSDAGLLPDGRNYILHVPPAGTGAISVRSTSGAPLGGGRTIFFSTPTSTLVNDLFLDPQPGPPSPKIWNPITQGVAEQEGNSYVAIGDPADPQNVQRVYFEFDPATLSGSLPELLPLNLYSNKDTAVSVVVEFNQPVNPSVQNISTNRVRLEFQNANFQWIPLPATIGLEANCIESGATLAGSRVRLTPLGILPQARPMRVVVASEFEDLVGQRNQVDLKTFALMETAIATDPGTMTPGDAADELFEGFDSGATEDLTAIFNSPKADWGVGGSSTLKASFDFSGSGGPGGEFDWHLAAGQIVVLDTSSSIITGGPGGLPVTQQVVIGGVVNVRNLLIPAGTTLRVQGPNPLTILASGTVTINGNLFCRGNSNSGVVTLNTNFQPEQGASGNGGGGRGGTGSFNTTQATPNGGPGFGAFGVPAGGGQGGDSSFNTGSVDARRPGGGAGGVLGATITVIGNAACPDQLFIGLDPEDGFNGTPAATSAVTNTAPPRGGLKGAGPWADAAANNNFFGTRVVNGADMDPLNDVLIEGELLQPTAGTGGGGGGDAYNSTSFPTNPYNPFSDDKGAGGGGGGGSITILALGDITVGPNGTINADGGLGGGGENTGGINRVGGGSGGGSGGHIILQTASQIDFMAVTGSAKIVARGGQGGAGRNDQGGAKAGASMTLPNFDGIHSAFANCPGAPLFKDVECCGGDGGPGILQLHAPSTADIIGPGGFPGGIRNICYPRPIGFNPANAVNDFVDLMVPIFGRFSASRSKWIQLGGVHVDPGTAVPEPITFYFGGIDAVSGLIESTGTSVDEIPALMPAVALGAGPGAPSYNNATKTVVLDAGLLGVGPLTDDLYKRNPALLGRFVLKADNAGTIFRYEITVADPQSAYDPALGTMTFQIVDDGTAGLNLIPGTTVEIIPHYFRVLTNGARDFLPLSSTVRIEFQAAPAGPSGAPDLVNAFPTADSFTRDITDLNGAPGNANFQFLRFQVTFDIQADAGNLGFDTPRPALEFLRVPIRF